MQQLDPLTADEQKISFRLRCDTPFGAQVGDILSGM